MSERIEAELELVRSVYPDVEFRAEDLWARVPTYPFPEGWGRKHGEIAFRVPRDVFGEEPYGFWVRPPLQVPGGGPPSNSSGPVATGFGEGWQQFSWAPDGWHPAVEVRCGTNMLDWVRSFTRRLKEVG
ncbi:MAG TPA: hypothetical protein VMB51_04065 [Solirubrobacteraceae bacterium]|nr:hypothetical protein [Solirubrobacteraceae bacterium]